MKIAMKRTLAALIAAMMLLCMSAVAVSAEEVDSDITPEDVFVDLYPVSESEEYVQSLFVGDVNNDFKVDVRDATLIQKYLADLVVLDESILNFNADTDGDWVVTIKDVTAIQKAVALLTNGVPVQPVATYTGSDIDMSIMSFGSGIVHLEVAKGAFYNINVSDPYLQFLILDGDYNILNVCNSYYDYLQAGSYIIYLTNFIYEETLDLSLSISSSDEFELFDVEDAIDVFPTNGTNFNAGEGPWVLRVPTNEDITIYTEGLNSDLNVMAFSKDLKLTYADLIGSYDGDLFGTSSPESFEDGEEYFYVYITQNEGGSDFVLYCNLFTDYLDSISIKVSIGSSYTIEVYDYGFEYEGLELFSFTPNTSGYYKICCSVPGGEGYFEVDDYDEFYQSFTINNEGSGVVYLTTGKTYYINAYIWSEYDISDNSFVITTSNEDEYNDSLKDNSDSSYDEFEIPTDCETISVEETKTVSLTEDEPVKWFKLTAVDNETVIIFSEGSDDALLEVYNSEGELIGYCDDMGEPFNSNDFSAIGDVMAGEEYYLCISSWGDDSAGFTVSVIRPEMIL